MPERRKIVNAGMVEKVLMLSRSRVEQLIRSGLLRKLAPGKYDLIECVQAYIRYLREDAKINNRDAANARVRDARAKDIEAKTAERLKQLVHVSVLEETIDGLCGLVRSEFAGLAAACTRDLVMRRIIEREVNARLRRIAENAMAKAIRLGGGGRADDAERANGAGPVGGEQSNVPADGSVPGPT